MLRAPVSDAETLSAHSRLSKARELMFQALELLDGTPVATDCDCHLDLAIHNLGQTIADVRGGEPIFMDRRCEDLVEADPESDRAIGYRLVQQNHGEPFA